MYDVPILQAKGLVGMHARLTIAAYDVDSGVRSDCFGSEADEVWFNGRRYGYLKGGDHAWAVTSFNIPVDRVRFPSAPGLKNYPFNELLIKVDVKKQCRCMTVGWFSLELQAAAPVVLLHGAGQTNAFWRKSVITFTKGLDAERIPWDASSTHTDPSIAVSAVRINSNLENIIRPQFFTNDYGVNEIHLVAHSKGGLDALRYLGTFYRDQIDQSPHPFRVLTLTTLDSPLGGTPGANVLDTFRAHAGRIRSVEGFPSDFWTNVLLPFLDSIFGNGIATLTTEGHGNPLSLTSQDGPTALSVVRDAMRTIKKLGPNRPRIITTASDLDVNGNGKLDCSETQGIEAFFPNPLCILTGALDVLYQNLRDVADARAESNTCWGLLPCILITAVPAAQPQLNDILVTIEGARGPDSVRAVATPIPSYVGSKGKNHANIATKTVAEEVIAQLGTQDKQVGGMRPLPHVVQPPAQ
ncbi:MAG: hypothetical protein J5J06_13915 [Phycisphaerae bacterium]|nr:hypothetical protein [Phycisphaerae bacterium]